MDFVTVNKSFPDKSKVCSVYTTKNASTSNAGFDK